MIVMLSSYNYTFLFYYLYAYVKTRNAFKFAIIYLGWSFVARHHRHPLV